MTRKIYLSKCPEKNSFFRWRITVRFAVWFQPGRTGFDDGFGAVIPVCSAGIALQVGTVEVWFAILFPSCRCGWSPAAVVDDVR